MSRESVVEIAKRQVIDERSELYTLRQKTKERINTVLVLNESKIEPNGKLESQIWTCGGESKYLLPNYVKPVTLSVTLLLEKHFKALPEVLDVSAH